MLGTQGLHQGSHFVVIVSRHRGEKASGGTGQSVASTPLLPPLPTRAPSLRPGSPAPPTHWCSIWKLRCPLNQSLKADCSTLHVVASCSGEGVEWPKVKEQRGLSSRKVPALPEGSGPPLPVTPFFPESSAHSESLWVLPPFPAWLCTYQWKDTGSPVSGGQGHGHRALATSSGCSHLVAEPVTVGVFVNIHDDVIHLRDPHKPVALQEPGRGHSSALEPVDLPSTGPAAVGTAPPSWLQAAQGRCRGISCGAGT